jgi:hypothetical protein
MVPARYFPDNDVAFNDKVYGYMWALTLGNAGLMLLKTTFTAVSYGGWQGIQSALLEHPAVSSVGFDVIFCWVTWGCWYRTQGGGVESVTRESIDRSGTHSRKMARASQSRVTVSMGLFGVVDQAAKRRLWLARFLEHPNVANKRGDCAITCDMQFEMMASSSPLPVS